MIVETLERNPRNVFSRRVRAGKRTYFFDVKATRSMRDFYIIITESKRVNEQDFEKHKIFLYKEDFKKFIDALTETVDHIKHKLHENVEDMVAVS